MVGSEGGHVTWSNSPGTGARSREEGSEGRCDGWCVARGVKSPGRTARGQGLGRVRVRMKRARTADVTTKKTRKGGGLGLKWVDY